DRLTSSRGRSPPSLPRPQRRFTPFFRHDRARAQFSFYSRMCALRTLARTFDSRARRCSRLFEESPFTPGHNMRARSQLRRAAAAVELAVLLPFLCFAFVVTADYLRVFYFSVPVCHCR